MLRNNECPFLTLHCERAEKPWKYSSKPEPNLPYSPSIITIICFSVDVLVDGKLCNLEDESIYLCGNSLGLMPLAAPHYINRELEKWATTGVHGHHNGDLPWARCDDYVITRSAELVGALPEEVSCQSGLSVNLHLLFAAFYNPTKERHKILMEGKAFPSDHVKPTGTDKFAVVNNARF